MRALLRGERSDLSDIVIDDTDIPEFNQRVYAIMRKIPPGATLTYGLVGERSATRRWRSARRWARTRRRSSCRAIACSPPAARAAASQASGGIVAKLQLLTIEGAEPNGPTLFAHLPLIVRRHG